MVNDDGLPPFELVSLPLSLCVTLLELQQQLRALGRCQGVCIVSLLQLAGWLACMQVVIGLATHCADPHAQTVLQRKTSLGTATCSSRGRRAGGDSCSAVSRLSLGMGLESGHIERCACCCGVTFDSKPAQEATPGVATSVWNCNSTRSAHSVCQVCKDLQCRSHSYNAAAPAGSTLCLAPQCRQHLLQLPLQSLHPPLKPCSLCCQVTWQQGQPFKSQPHKQNPRRSGWSVL
jgi:hypothetical protein